MLEIESPELSTILLILGTRKGLHQELLKLVRNHRIHTLLIHYFHLFEQLMENKAGPLCLLFIIWVPYLRDEIIKPRGSEQHLEETVHVAGVADILQSLIPLGRDQNMLIDC